MNGNLCPHCRTPNRPSSRFCIKCGTPLPGGRAAGEPDLCPRCRVPVRPGARFCPTCGYPLRGGASAARGAPAADADERKFVVQWPGGRTEKHILSKNVVYVGRAPSNDIVLNFPTVSAQHLRLDVTSSGIRVTDLGSTNGTQLNGRHIPPNAAQPLQPGDVMRVGDLRGNWVSMIFG